MLKSMIEKIVSLAAPTTYQIEGKTFASKDLTEIKPRKDEPRTIDVRSLNSLADIVRHECEMVGRKLFVQASGARSLVVFSTYDNEYDRFTPYTCGADTPNVTTGCYMDHEEAIIQLQSLYIPNEDTKYLLNLLSTMTIGDSVTSSDNGVTQTVTAKSGVSLREQVTVKPIVTLQPFRTFLEVAQPESRFLLRVNDRGQIGLFEADGGVWKLEAARSIAAYMEDKLSDLIEAGKVVVLR